MNIKKTPNKFISLVNNDLNQKTIDIINKKNRQEYYIKNSLCASHEYLDTNMYLLKALRLNNLNYKINSNAFFDICGLIHQAAVDNNFKKIKNTKFLDNKINHLEINGPGGLEISRDCIIEILLSDLKIAKILGSRLQVYFDGMDLVSSKWDDQTIARIDYKKPMIIQDLKNEIIKERR